MLLAKAVENARQQAAVVANAGGRTLGTLISASFSTVNQVERSAARPMLNKTATEDNKVPTQIEAKNITISVNVNTVFKLLYNTPSKKSRALCPALFLYAYRTIFLASFSLALP